MGELLKQWMYAGYRQLTSFDFSGDRLLQVEHLKMGKWYKIGIRADFVPLSFYIAKARIVLISL
ncbi:hypothetical protein [Streptococcus porci]|uniref:hypothetical protein n=1 Tax=Streptococcus porci TaxID=502567 RepID=UPI0003F8A611|nr:hypothetical protein [Streptococcus porci]